MDEFVSKKLLVAKFNELASKYTDRDKRQRGLAYATAADIIAFTDAADVQPVIHAYWIELPKALNPNENPCKCSNCGHILSFMNGYPKSKYCDECGAKMDIIYEDDKIRAIKVTGWNNDARNLTDEETDIYNDRLEAEAKTIDEISLLLCGEEVKL